MKRNYNKVIKHIGNVKYIRSIIRPYNKAKAERLKFYDWLQSKHNITVEHPINKQETFQLHFPDHHKINFKNELEAMIWLAENL